MRGRFLLLPAAALGLFLAAPARADEIIYFTNGTTLAVQSHVVQQDGMIRVDLGSNARMAFPSYMVERIVSGGGSVYVNPEFRPANQAVPGSGGGSGSGGSAAAGPVAYEVGGYATASSSSRSRPGARGVLGPDGTVAAGSLGGGETAVAGGVQANAATQSLRAIGSTSRTLPVAVGDPSTQVLSAPTAAMKNALIPTSMRGVSSDKPVALRARGGTLNSFPSSGEDQGASPAAEEAPPPSEPSGGENEN